MKKNIPILLISALLTGHSAGAQTVTIEWHNVRQTIDGFGASDAWFSDEIMQHPDRDEILDLLFSRRQGAGLSILRHRIPPRMGDWTDYFIELDSGDLDFGTRPAHGIRFTGLSIPQGAAIDNAYIQFVAKDNLSATCRLVLSGQAADDPKTFSNAQADVSKRPETSARVTWNVPPWNNNESGSKQQTADLTPVVQEIVNRSGWQSGNSLVIFVKGMSGKRSARTFDGAPDRAPELVVRYNSMKTLRKKVVSSTDDAEENGQSYLSHGASVTREAFTRGCERVWAAAWTPPAEWKTNAQHNNGGFLKDRHYQDWAERLEYYRSEMDRRSGIPLYGISPQNEPGKKSWESCRWDKSKFRDFIKNNLGPTLAATCRIIVPEETNWNNVDNFYNPIHNDPAARAFVDIVAGHCYGGDPNVSYAQFGKPVWETEWSYDTSKDDLSINNGVIWAHNFWKLLVNAETSACHYWWLVNFNDDGRQQALISASPNLSGLNVSKRLWVLGNYSRFVRPGWQRIVATKTPVDNVYISAFKGPANGEFAVVAVNKSSADKKLTLVFDGFSAPAVTPYRTSADQNIAKLDDISVSGPLAVTLPGKTVTTFTGPASSDSGVAGDGTESGTTPLVFTLFPNYPNPFNPATTISFHLTDQAGVEVTVYDAAGRFVRTLFSGVRSAGVQSVLWNGTGRNGKRVPSGVYICRLDVKSGAGAAQKQQKMLLIK